MKRIYRLLAPALALAAAAVTGTGATAQAQAAPAPAAHIKPLTGSYVQMENLSSGLCMTPQSPVNQSQILQQVCVPDSPAQGWAFESLGGNNYQFLNQGSGLCLFAFTGAHTGAPMGLNVCRTVSNEQYDAHAQLPDVTELESRIGFTDSGFCVGDPNGSPLAGVQMELFKCDGSESQRWFID